MKRTPNFNFYVPEYSDEADIVPVGANFEALDDILGSQTTNTDGIYGVCSTAAATAAKTVQLANSEWVRTVGALVAVKFTYAVPANATLNVNGTGAGQMRVGGVQIKANMIPAGGDWYLYLGRNLLGSAFGGHPSGQAVCHWDIYRQWRSIKDYYHDRRERGCIYTIAGTCPGKVWSYSTINERRHLYIRGYGWARSPRYKPKCGRRCDDNNRWFYRVRQRDANQHGSISNLRGV